MIKNILITVNILLICGCNTSDKSLYKNNPAFYSYAIGNINDTTPQITHNDAVYITPASCQKIITALLSYKILGADYRYKTPIYITKDKCKPKDIVISFSGDPTLKSSDIIKTLQPLIGTKFRNIYLDASKYKTPANSPNIMLTDIGTSYAAPVSSMIIDHNNINITLYSPTVTKKPHSDPSYIIKSFIMSSRDITSLNAKIEGKHIILKGNININEKDQWITIAPIEINNYIIKKIGNIIRSLNISGRIKIVYNKSDLPVNLKQVGEVVSPSLGEFLPPALKKSDNLVFDSLYLNIVNSQQKITDWSKGNEIIHDLVCKYLNVDLKQAYIVDGSGLSRYNRIQTRTLYEILKQGYHIPEFVNALVTPGEANSTMSRRCSLLQTIKAKTGFMTGISCLCGYNITHISPKIFVISVSNFAPPISNVTNEIDKFINSKVTH